jgi:hypothetical protein
MNLIRSRSRWFSLLAVLMLTAVTGCGPGRGEVRGTVFVDGKPLPSGTIQFLGVDGIPCAGAIGPDGTFSVQVPRGDAKVIVTCMNEIRMQQVSAELRTASGSRSAPPAAMPDNLSKIPIRYADWTTSGLSVRVTGRKNEQDFALTSN